MNSKFGMFSVLVFGIMILLIPASSLANAQEYDDRHYEDNEYKKIDKKSSNEPYKKDEERKSYYNDDNKKSEEPVIIIKNEPIQKKEKKKMEEPPMLVVKKEILYCDVFSGSDQRCDINGGYLGPDNEKYVKQCSGDNIVCNNINESIFDMIVTDNIEFPGSEDGKKITFNGERYTVTEDVNIGETEGNNELNFRCQESGFDSGFITNTFDFGFIACVLNEGKCSGFVQDGELKECTIKNYIVDAGT